MPWIASLGRRQCNDCRTITPTGESVYQGITGMLWCRDCAVTNLGVTWEDVPPPATTLRFPDGWGRFSPRPIASWHERED